MIVLGLGSNISNTMHTREENIATAIRLLGNHPRISIEKLSLLYETEPVGLKEQPSFLNAVIAINTDLQPLELLSICLETERQMGRVREVRWGPRNIDIDLLVYHDVEMTTTVLELPHPRMPERKFVLIPLAEIAGHIAVYKGKTAQDLLMSTIDDSQVNVYGAIYPSEQAATLE
ncbi:2-amino-4-hydroxy-6-hydroxymethyldihydropteridine diphosphokinase [Sporomusa sp. KB1]|jgi:2-amino-4-hydroxy-6-hydroxymethyldihydropteridine diphosphokinase|uniref:2-amino-4-hydroxy-6- hydroxymethyldihydropteridine diphosphokinase n=1 Tax=Sporomusa sp. KB1 TaxID=943346 RepID=UPI0011A6720E|nr:2-amino-4-hydroxy-6-hydroxymethyldihydropteridine diphosphokinase [Sporomusa sp. KB1]TWH48581.1 2-amino-4-hydroxy-6-hydroxymethyldihydropteridine diphosphokinase [Sporomusa sp. KB1]